MQNLFIIHVVACYGASDRNEFERNDGVACSPQLKPLQLQLFSDVTRLFLSPRCIERL